MKSLSIIVFDNIFNNGDYVEKKIDINITDLEKYLVSSTFVIFGNEYLESKQGINLIRKYCNLYKTNFFKFLYFLLLNTLCKY